MRRYRKSIAATRLPDQSATCAGVRFVFRIGGIRPPPRPHRPFSPSAPLGSPSRRPTHDVSKLCGIMLHPRERPKVPKYRKFPPCIAQRGRGLWGEGSETGGSPTPKPRAARPEKSAFSVISISVKFSHYSRRNVTSLVLKFLALVAKSIRVTADVPQRR